MIRDSTLLREDVAPLSPPRQRALLACLQDRTHNRHTRSWPPRTDPRSLPGISRAPSHSRQDTHESVMRGRGVTQRGELATEENFPSYGESR